MSTSRPVVEADAVEAVLIEALRANLANGRSRLLGLVEHVSEEVLCGQHAPVMGPIVWDLGHIAAFEELWLVKAVDGWRPQKGGGLPALFDAGIHARSVRGDLDLPDVDQSVERLARVRQATWERLGNGLGGDDPLTSHGFVWNMVAQHEAWHIETILAALNLREDCRLSPNDAPEAVPTEPGRVHHPGGAVSVGTDDRTYAYDNERSRHTVELAPFALASHPVTVAEYRQFVADGGYTTESVWTPAGWEWVQANAARGPHGWRDGGVQRFGALVEPDPTEPVQHVCSHEAVAFARWAGARLPSEHEWEVMAGQHGDPGAGFAESTTLGPAPNGTVDAWFGNVWEWTRTEFHAYPGFVWFPYRDYSAPFFGEGYPVLRGGSWASGRVLLRPTLRSWDLPIRRETIFVGFRLAWDG